MLSRLVFALLFVLPAVAVRAEQPVRFDVEVMAALSKAGCNAGVCHGNQNGKGGFQLSLRGQDPSLDFFRLTREANGRRIDRLTPNASLILTKPSGRVPHGGGVRLPSGSPEYEVLRRWIVDGAQRSEAPTVVSLEVTPRQAVVRGSQRTLQLKVVATFSDSSQRDVTNSAVYEPTGLMLNIRRDGLVRSDDFGEANVIVRFLDHQVPVLLAFLPEQPDYQWPDPPQYNVIDRRVDEKLQRLQIVPAELCSDTTFVRRAFLDTLGVPPTAEEAKRFVSNTDPSKRSRLVDHLLARPEFADHWTLKWADVLRTEEKVLDKKGVAVFHEWIHESIRSGKPLDRFVRELVTAKGSTYKSPPANFYRANRTPNARGETAARLFLGVRLQCAQCHNHPFDRWTQDDYYNWAALFSRVDYKIVENKRRDKLDKNEFNGEQIVLWKDRDEVKNARTGDAASPAFLGGGPIDPDRQDDRLAQLADWLTSPENQLFVKSQANWIWFHLMGRGIVEPVDDFRLTNPPSNAALLDAVADELIRSGFDLRSVVRLIMNSRVYQAASIAKGSAEYDSRNFARIEVRRLTAEQLLDAQSRFLQTATRFNGYEVGVRAAQLQGVQRVRDRDERPAPGDRFLRTFGKPQRLLACECERSNETSLNQAFELIAGDAINDLLQSDDNLLTKLSNSDLTASEVVDELFWAALSRAPTPLETTASVEAIENAPSRLDGVRDVAWALVNAKAFIYRQ